MKKEDLTSESGILMLNCYKKGILLTHEQSVQAKRNIQSNKEM